MIAKWKKEWTNYKNFKQRCNKYYWSFILPQAMTRLCRILCLKTKEKQNWNVTKNRPSLRAKVSLWDLRLLVCFPPGRSSCSLGMLIFCNRRVLGPCPASEITQELGRIWLETTAFGIMTSRPHLSSAYKFHITGLCLYRNVSLIQKNSKFKE